MPDVGTVYIYFILFLDLFICNGIVYTKARTVVFSSKGIKRKELIDHKFSIV